MLLENNTYFLCAWANDIVIASGIPPAQTMRRPAGPNPQAKTQNPKPKTTNYLQVFSWFGLAGFPKGLQFGVNFGGFGRHFYLKIRSFTSILAAEKHSRELTKTTKSAGGLQAFTFNGGAAVDRRQASSIKTQHTSEKRRNASEKRRRKSCPKWSPK